MIDVRQPGESIVITDTPSSIATAMLWFARVSVWLGLALAVGGIAMTGTAIVRGGEIERGLGIVGRAILLALFGWAGRRGWRKLATARRTVIDRARGTIELAESSPGGAPHARSELVADVVDVVIEGCETTGPERTPLRVLRLWLRLRHDRRLLLGDVGDVGGARRSLERAATLVAGFFGVTIARESNAEVEPAVERVAGPHLAAASTRAWPLLTLHQRLLYVPGIALLLCGGTYVALVIAELLGGDAAKLAGARTFVLAVSPVC